MGLAMVEAGSTAERERLLLMAHKLLRFSTILMIPALVAGAWLWLVVGIGRGPDSGWMHAKLALVLAVGAYHHVCARLLRSFVTGQNTRPHTWFRFFNEASVLLFAAIVVLVVVKPF